MTLGQVAGAYGVRGWIRVQVDDPEDLRLQPQWWVGGVERTVEAARAHGGALVAKLQGVEDREQARMLTGAPVELPRNRLPALEAGQFFWADLVGLAVVNESGVVLGRVQSLFSNGAHDVMVLEGPEGGSQRLLPWVPAVVRSVDLEHGRIEVDWGADW
jgi:16S rRNA processing protein RimM